MDELIIGEKTYISSKRAAKITGYAKDYIGQLCREGRVEARLVGRNWYVLETSITEHRFGVAEKENEIAPVEAKAVGSIDAAWSKPTYKTESPVQIPPLMQKDSEIVSSRRVVSEMQTAWQEWFNTQAPRPETLIEEGDEVFDGSMLPVLTNTEEEVSITRIEAATEADNVTHEPHVEEVVHIQPISVYEERRAMPTEIMDLSTRLAAAAETVSVQPSVKERTGSSLVLKTLLLGIAFISVCVTLVGTGLLQDLTDTSYDKDSAQGRALEFLGGKSEYKNSK